MISVALMSDNTSKRSESTEAADGPIPRRAEIRLGQCVVMFELMCRIRDLRINHDKLVIKLTYIHYLTLILSF